MARGLAAIVLVLSFAAATARAQQENPNAVAEQPLVPINRAPAAGAPQAASDASATQAAPTAPATPSAPAAKPAVAPFQLTAEQQRVLHDVLVNYERKTSAIKTFSADLARLEFDPVFGPQDPSKPRSTGGGSLRYTKPDKAKYEIENVQLYDSKTGKYAPDADAAEFVVINGKEVILKNFRKKQIQVTPLPKEMQGEGIFYGPLPFVFGAKAEDLERRYFMRLTTPEAAAKAGQIWLEAYPRFQADAANYKRVDLIIRHSDMLPIAIQVHNPNGKNRTVYTFENQKIDSFKWNPFGDDYKVSTPFGWQRLVEKPPAENAASAANPVQPPR
jgi:TIGR03009 family protein